MVRGWILIFAFLLLFACTTTEEYPILESGKPAIRSGSLVFTGTDGNLYVAEAGESSLIRLTKGARFKSPSRSYSAYVWSDRNLVYTTREFDREGSLSSSMYIARPGERRRRVFTIKRFVPFYLYATADGSRVSYLGSEQGTGRQFMGSVDLDSSVRVSHGRGNPYFVSWSPDGNTLIRHIGPSFVVTASDLSFQHLDQVSGRTAPADETLDIPTESLDLAPGPFKTPDFSPDGSRIAVVLRDDEGLSIHLIDAHGTDIEQIVDLDRSAASVAWSPDGDGMAYVDGAETQIRALVGRLAIKDLESGRTRQVSERAMAPFWSPNGKKLLYFEPEISRGQQGEQLLYRVGLYAVENNTARIIARMRPAPAFAQQIIPFADQYERSHTIWSPDSRLVALNTTGRSGRPNVILLDTGAGEKRGGGLARSISFRSDRFAASGASGIQAQTDDRSRILANGTLPFFSRE